MNKLISLEKLNNKKLTALTICLFIMTLYSVISGKEFKATFTPDYVYKILRSDLVHNDYMYQLGHNEDPNDFIPDGECSGGGLYFTTLDHIFKFLDFGTKIATIEIYDVSKVYIEKEKFKANEFHIIKIQTVKEFINQSEAMCKFAIRQNWRAFYLIENQTLEMCELAANRKSLDDLASNSDSNTTESIKKQMEKIYRMKISKL